MSAAQVFMAFDAIDPELVQELTWTDSGDNSTANLAQQSSTIASCQGDDEPIEFWVTAHNDGGDTTATSSATSPILPAHINGAALDVYVDGLGSLQARVDGPGGDQSGRASSSRPASSRAMPASSSSSRTRPARARRCTDSTARR